MGESAKKPERNEFEDLIGDFDFDLTEDMEVEDEPSDEVVEGDEEPSGDSDSSDMGDSDDSADSDSPSGDAKEDSEEPEEGPIEEGSEEEAKPSGEKDELTLLKEQNAKLLEELNKNISDPIVESKEEAVQKNPLDEIDPEELLDDPAAFKKFLADYAESIRNETVKKSEATITQQVQAQLNVNRLVENFYQDNPQLAGVKKYVGALAKEISSEHPDKTYEDVLNETAERAYKNLGIAKKLVKTDPKKPSFAKAGGKAPRAQQNNDKRSDQEKQIDAIINLDI